jgi:hypothetical protein
VISDRFSTGYSEPSVDAQQDAVIIPAESQPFPANNSWVITFLKNVSSAADSTADRDWPKTSSEFIYAVGNSPVAADAKAKLPQHTVQGRFSVLLYPSPVGSPGNNTTDANPDGICVSASAPRFCVKAKKSDASTVQITYTVSDIKKYVALGIGKGMADADCFIAWVSPGKKIILSDRYSSGRVIPAVDAKQDLTLVESLSSVNGDSWVATFTRPLKASEASTDKDLTESATANYIWAVGDAPADANPSATFSVHSSRGVFQVRFLSSARIFFFPHRTF